MSESQEKSVFADHFVVTVEVSSPTGKKFTSSYMVLDKQILGSSEPIRMLLEVMTTDMAIIATSAVADAENNR